MRPRAALLTLVVALALVGAGCAAGPRGATAPHAIEQVLPAKALDVAAARVAARAFVQAYAASATDRGLALRRLVVGRELTRWVRWLGIQNGQFEGAIRAEAEVREVRFLGVALGDTYDVARVRLRATVTFAYAPDGGETFILERVLDGPMLLVRVGQEDWKVADVTREGAPLSEGIRDLGRARVTRDGVAIVLDSAFVFAIGWQVNVTVENRTDGEIRLASVRLVVGGAAADGRATAPLRSIPRTTGAVGILSFGRVAVATGATLEVRYETALGIATLRIPLGELIGDVADAAASPSAEASA
ncbi:MAG: hypothetical protein ACKOKE_01565 [Actinomycetota bacterium]